MKILYHITPEEALSDTRSAKLRHAPDGVPQQIWNHGHSKIGPGDLDVAWYRGRHAGLYDAYLLTRIARKFGI